MASTNSIKHPRWKRTRKKKKTKQKPCNVTWIPTKNWKKKSLTCLMRQFTTLSLKTGTQWEQLSPRKHDNKCDENVGKRNPYSLMVGTQPLERSECSFLQSRAELPRNPAMPLLSTQQDDSGNCMFTAALFERLRKGTSLDVHGWMEEQTLQTVKTRGKTWHLQKMGWKPLLG